MKKQNFGKRRSTIDRFNQPCSESNYLEIFQIAMSEKLMLKSCGEFDKKAFQRFLWRRVHRRDKYIDLKIKPLLLTCKVSPEFYLDVQETAKEMLGEYAAMDELIIFLLDYFVENYGRENRGGGTPLFVRKFKGRSESNLKRFQSRFRPYFKNHVVSFKLQ